MPINSHIEFDFETTNLSQATPDPYLDLKRSRRQKSFAEYIDTLFNRHSKLLVIRVDLHYRMDIPHTKTVDDVVKDFIHFRNCERWINDIYEGKVGYARLIEYGQDKGFHIHYMAFYDGSKRHADAWIADRLGELWNRSTQGLGYHWNCNTQEYDIRSIGMLHRNQYFLINHLKSVVANYLTKLNQLPAGCFNRQLFRMGQLRK